MAKRPRNIPGNVRDETPKVVASISAQVTGTPAAHQYSADSGSASILVFLSEGGSATIRSGAQAFETPITPGTTALVTGSSEDLSLTWTEKVNQLRLVLPDSFVQNVTSEIAGADSDLAEIVGLYSADAGFGSLANRIARRMTNDGDGAGSGTHIRATAQFLLALLIHSRRSAWRLGTVLPDGLYLSDARFRRVVRFIEQDLTSPIHVPDLARVATQSTYHFTRTFKGRTGKSPHSFVLERRIRRAEALLAETDTPLAQVAHDSGFSSQSHLTTAFRRWVGLTPGCYRSLIKS